MKFFSSILSYFDNQFNEIYLASGIFAVSYLMFFPAAVMRSIYAIKRINIINNTYKEVLLAFTKKEKQFMLIQRASILLNVILVVVILPVIEKIFNGKDILKLI